jgi:chromosome segregation ATPase
MENKYQVIHKTIIDMGRNIGNVSKDLNEIASQSSTMLASIKSLQLAIDTLESKVERYIQNAVSIKRELEEIKSNIVFSKVLVDVTAVIGDEEKFDINSETLRDLELKLIDILDQISKNSKEIETIEQKVSNMVENRDSLKKKRIVLSQKAREYRDLIAELNRHIAKASLVKSEVVNSFKSKNNITCYEVQHKCYNKKTKDIFLSTNFYGYDFSKDKWYKVQIGRLKLIENSEKINQLIKIVSEYSEQKDTVEN